MIPVNTSPLKCIGHGCSKIPTIVFYFDALSGRKVLGQAITCLDHENEGLAAGRQFGRYSLRKDHYPPWLRTIHQDIIHDGPKKDSVKLEKGDLERLREFLYPGNTAPMKR